MTAILSSQERFEASYIKTAGGCWIWNKCVNRLGYGGFQQGNKIHRANRWALEQKLGRKIEPGLLALHRCDNPPCVNPDHLYEGTQKDNMLDRLKRGRWKGGQPKKTHCIRGHELSGENISIRQKKYKPHIIDRICKKCRSFRRKRKERGETIEHRF